MLMLRFLLYLVAGSMLVTAMCLTVILVLELLVRGALS